MNSLPRALFESCAPGRAGRSFRFDTLQQLLTATTAAEVLPLFAAVQAGVARGLHAAGFVSYEAAAAFDPALATHPRGDLPLACFGLFAERTQLEPGTLQAERPARLLQPLSGWDEATYTAAFCKIAAYIAAGDCYQVNLTFRQRFRFAGEPFALYRQLCAAQPAAFCAWLNLGDRIIASTSPELFFSRHGEHIVMQPMKGTTPRGGDPAADRRLYEHLRTSPKERAENLMIVDLVRNDLGRIATTGSVGVPALFHVESLPTLHQMTSTVSARLPPQTTLVDIFRALFPCGSVTGAPKRRSMEIIRTIEDSPRGLYCGAIGFLSPGEDAVFSVAIRTVTLDPDRGVGELGLGSGVTADAAPAAEYGECLHKGAFLVRQAEPLHLVETLRWQPGAGFSLLDRHLARLAASARTLGFGCDPPALSRQLHGAVAAASVPCKVRLLLATDGTATITVSPLPKAPPAIPPARVALTARVIDPGEPLLYHKTTWRPWYDDVLDQHPGCLDVLFRNGNGEVTEGTLHNLVVEAKGCLLTPPVACGLLPGTLRAELLARGIVREARIDEDTLRTATRLWLINSVRGWRRVRLT